LFRDASAVVALLLNSGNAFQIAEKFFAAGETLHAPHLLDVEVAQVLRRYLLSGQIETARGLEALEDLADLSLQRYPHDLFLPRIWAS
jgi:predicted nucleic acid-binding protein